MEKIWLQSYEAHVPSTINPNAYPSLVALAEECFQKYSANPCYSNLGVHINYRQLDELTQAFAGFLQAECMMKAGERLIIMLPNILQYPIVMLGALRAGLTVVNVNPLYTPRELRNILQDSKATGIVVLANFAHVVEKALPGSQVKNVIVTELGDLLGLIKGTLVNMVVKYGKKLVPPWHIPNHYSFKAAINACYVKKFSKPNIQSTDIAFLQYTGGTTGGVKGAMLTHRNMIANILQAHVWIDSFFNDSFAHTIITALPLYHIFSLLANCFVFLYLGYMNVLITNPRDIPTFVKELKRQPFSVITGVNTLFNALLHNEEFCRMDFSQFKFTLGGGMAVQKAVAEQWKRVTGVSLLEAYGLTECSPAVTINPLDLQEYNGSIGLPLPSTEIKICSDEGNELPIGESGELWVRGPQVMQGYWQQPEKTKEVLAEDGWLKTGDIATIDEKGYVRIVDRKKDIIIVSGFNVYPNEIEDVIASFKGVKEVAVIGVKSFEHGEVAKAFVVRDNPELTGEEIIAYCHQQLTGYKVPKEIEFRTELPKSNVGKVLRRALREEEATKSK